MSECDYFGADGLAGQSTSNLYSLFSTQHSGSFSFLTPPEDTMKELVIVSPLACEATNAALRQLKIAVSVELVLYLVNCFSINGI